MLKCELDLENRPEKKSFLGSALAWKGSVTPIVLPRVFVAMLYSIAVILVGNYWGTMSITPFEYSGGVLGLLLVLRVNAGLDRWWEARKIWGSIVNQSRNLAIIGYEYCADKKYGAEVFLPWVAAWPHIMREALRKQDDLEEVTKLLGWDEANRLRNAQHRPSYAGACIAKTLQEMRKRGLDDFAFQRAERERALLMDAIGGCERIKSTPIPLVLAIKTRRFILFFLLLLPFALVDRVGWSTPLIVAIASYPLFSLDEIGAILQNPFSPRNLSHLPLGSICENIENNVIALRNH